MSKTSLGVEKAAKALITQPATVQPIIPGASATGLSLPPGISFEAWEGIGRTVGQIASAHQWWAGDWWNYGEREYGERAYQADLLGIEPKTISNWAWVAEQYDPSLRRERVSFGHHSVVAKVSEPARSEWLAQVLASQDAEGRGGMSVRDLEKAVRVPQLPIVALPPGKYNCIVIDPPWPMEKIERDVRPNQGPVLDYPTMSIEEIAALPVADLAADPGAHVYLWTTHRFLPDALSLFESWGATYQCLMTWVKNVGITPFSWMYDTEHVLFGRIGQLPLDQLGLRLSFNAPVTVHSAKPDVFYERVVSASPGPRLEMFARTERDGFTAWGNEVPSVA